MTVWRKKHYFLHLKHLHPKNKIWKIGETNCYEYLLGNANFQLVILVLVTAIKRWLNESKKKRSLFIETASITVYPETHWYGIKFIFLFRVARDKWSMHVLCVCYGKKALINDSHWYACNRKNFNERNAVNTLWAWKFWNDKFGPIRANSRQICCNIFSHWSD